MEAGAPLGPLGRTLSVGTQLDDRTRGEVFRLAVEMAHDTTAESVVHEYKRLARVVRMAMRRAKDVENDRQWKEAVRV